MARFCAPPITLQFIVKVFTEVKSQFDQFLDLHLLEGANNTRTNEPKKISSIDPFESYQSKLNQSIRDGTYTSQLRTIVSIPTTVGFESCYLAPENPSFSLASGAVSTMTGVIGVVGNLILVATLIGHIPFLRRVQPYLLTLAIMDTLLIINCWCLYTLNELIGAGFITIHDVIYLYVQPYMYTTANTLVTAHMWLTLAIALDRYLTVHYTTTFPVQQQSKWSRVNCIVIYFAAMLFAMPRFLDYDTTEREDQSVSLVYSELYRTPSYWITYHVACYFVFVSCGPYVILVYLIVSTVRALKTQQVNSNVRDRGEYVNLRVIQVPRASMDGTEESPNAIPELIPSDHQADHAKSSPETSEPHQTAEKVLKPFDQSIMSIPILTLAFYFLPIVRDITILTVNMNSDTRRVYFSYVNAIITCFIPLESSCNFYIYWLCSVRYRKYCTRKICSYGRRLSRFIRIRRNN